MAAMTAPLLIFIGEADAWNPAEACPRLAAHARPDAEKIELVVYPGAHHAVDIVAFNPGRSLRGRWVEYDETAAKDAEEKTRAFLDAHLIKTSPGEPNLPPDILVPQSEPGGVSCIDGLTRSTP